MVAAALRDLQGCNSHGVGAHNLDLDARGAVLCRHGFIFTRVVSMNVFLGPFSEWHPAGLGIT